MYNFIFVCTVDGKKLINKYDINRLGMVYIILYYNGDRRHPVSSGLCTVYLVILLKTPSPRWAIIGSDIIISWVPFIHVAECLYV